MSRFQEQKKLFTALCQKKDWPEALREEITDAARAKGAANAFLALLNRPETRWQAAFALGLCLSLMAADNMESARVFMRRLMWSLNEESGNLGWGIPEAMGCILAASPALAGEYARIFISYGYETGRDDNFLDHGPLRRGVYWGIGRLARANPARALPALPHLVKALNDPDGIICGHAAWALLQLAASAPAPAVEKDTAWTGAVLALRREKKAREQTGQGSLKVELLEGEAVIEESLGDILDRALAAAGERG